MPSKYTPQHPNRRGSNFIDLTGQRFGRWSVIERAANDTGWRPTWLCRCDCGTERVVDSHNLKKGGSQSCGCIATEKTSKRSRTHGMSHTTVHIRWMSMIQRCTNPLEAAYPNYGGRGITVCDEWSNEFQAFYDHVSTLPHFGEKGRSLDRIDNDGNYEPGNVRWATRPEQQRNTSRNVLITFNDKTLCLTDWANEIGLPRHVLQDRLFKLNWPIERALMTPARKMRPKPL
jgi:hypothetical protein